MYGDILVLGYPNYKRILKLHDWFKFKRYGNVKWWIANGLILPSGEVNLGRVCY